MRNLSFLRPVPVHAIGDAPPPVETAPTCPDDWATAYAASFDRQPAPDTWSYDATGLDLRLLRRQVAEWRSRALAAEDYAEQLREQVEDQRRLLGRARLAIRTLRDPGCGEAERAFAATEGGVG